MRRRALLAAVGANTAALAGCGGIPGLGPTPTPSAEELPAVTATYQVSYGLQDVRRRILTVERGSLTYEATCRGDREGEGGVTVEESLDTDTYADFQRRVVRSQPAEWDERYPCRTGCAEDALGYSLAVTVDGQEYATGVGGLADPPAPIQDLEQLLHSLRRRYDGTEDCSDR